MNIDEELNKNLKEVQHILNNQLTKKIILDYIGEYIDYPKLVNSINLFVENFSLIIDSNNDELIVTLVKHLKHFIANTKDETKINLYHMDLLNDINYFLEYHPKIDIGGKMDKVKIQDIASEADLSNAELVKKAKELGFNVKAGNSTISIENAGILVDYAIGGTLPKGFKKPGQKSKITVLKKKEKTQSIWVISPGENAEIWNECHNGGYIAIGWDKLDLNDYKNKSAIKKDLKKYHQEKDNTRKDTFLWNFAHEININDIVIARQGRSKVIGIGYITSDYISPNSLNNPRKNMDAYKQIRKVNWIENNEYYTENDAIFSRDTVSKLSVTDARIKNMIKNLDKNNVKEIREDSPSVKISKIKQKFSSKEFKYIFPYKNILLKGVPGTGKSRTLENIINNQLNLKDHYETNVLRINVHSASSNADLMQGIGISSNDDGQIEYKEKQGLILEIIERATFNPNQPFVLVLEEIQENSLNELIGDLIYLIEDSKRAKGYKANDKEYTYSELLDEIMTQNSDISSIKLPSLINKSEKIKRMVIPHNLYIFCTSNYRDDRKVIEDNLLRRFEVIEIYPLYQNEEKTRYTNDLVAKFLDELNISIMKVCQESGEIHPDRFMIGHSIWLEVNSKKEFYRAFLKVITEFKDIKDTHFDEFKKITKELTYPFDIEENYESYEAWIKALQAECYDFLS